MDFKTVVTGAAGSSAAVAADALLVIVASVDAAAALEQPLADEFARALREGDIDSKPGRVLYAHRVAGVKAGRVAFAFAGAATARAYRKALAAGLGALKAGGTKSLAVVAAGFGALDASHGEAVAVLAAEATYLYRETKPSAPAPARLKSVAVICAAKAEAAAVTEGLRVGQALAEGTTLAREWANRPGNHCTPTHLATLALGMAKSHGLKVEVLERKDCEKLGMGSFLSVAQGSDEPPKFIVMRWMGGAKADAPVVLVGKGITFDTGGISLKPAAEMDEMKFDMGGAASVLGTMAAVARLKAKVNLVGIVAATENMPSASVARCVGVQWLPGRLSHSRA
ncbi:MAG: putative cytosol aminopeptidase, partial [Pseudomonadota bacterium]